MRNKNSNEDDKAIFSITIGDLQQEAIRTIGRRLAEKELYTAKKGIEAGLSFDIETVFKTAIEETVENNE